MSTTAGLSACAFFLSVTAVVTAVLPATFFALPLADDIAEEEEEEEEEEEVGNEKEEEDGDVSSKRYERASSSWIAF